MDVCDTMNFHDKHGRNIRLSWDEDTFVCTADHGGKNVGAFSFSIIEEDQIQQPLALITHCDVAPGYRRAGIGKAIVQHVKVNGYVVVMRHENGPKFDDGSYLIGDGPGFARSLESQRLIYRYPYVSECDD